MKYLYYALLGLMTVLAVGLLFKYVGKRAPTGPDSSTWALGIVYVIILLFLIGLSLILFYFKKPGIALGIILSPFILMILTTVVSGSVDIYAWFPSFSKVAPVNIVVKNQTYHPLHIRLECMFSTLISSDQVVYKTLDYYTEPNTDKTISMDNGDSRLLAKKVSSVGVYVFFRDSIKTDQGLIWTDIEPCAIYQNEKPEAFSKGDYLLDVNALMAKKGK